VRPGLRVTLLLALLTVSLGGIVSVGFISVWRTRAALAEARYERVAFDAELAARVVGAFLGARREPDQLGQVLDIEGERLRGALGAQRLVVLDQAGQPLWPRGAPSLATDATGASAAIAGLAPSTQTVPGREPGTDVVLYASVPGPGRPLAARLETSISEGIDEVLARARTGVILLGILDGLVLLGAAAWLLSIAVVRPVRELERAAERVAAGDLTATPRVRGVGELAHLATAFDGMTRSLREGRESLIRTEKLAGVGRLAAGVAHEVGNPLAAILGYTEMLLGETPERPIAPELRKDVLERVRAETQRIHRIIQELLDYSRAPRAAAEPVDLVRVASGALSLTQAQARFKPLAIDLDIPADVGLVRGDPGRLTQVLLNLMINAGDATGGEGRVTVRARREGARVVVTVADDGPGVPAELRDKIFDPFFTTKEPGAGTGLGLSVSLAIVEGMGGKLTLGTPERGAEFVIDLPGA
jgi:two-component system NtrC family sensor kinase